MIVPIIRNQNNKFTVAKVHYSLDPDKATAEWLAEARRGMPENGFKREYEIDYSYYAGKPFFPEFSEYNIAKEPIAYQERETIYRAWDFGFHRPCCVITKLNERDQWCWLKVILGQDEWIDVFGRRVKQYCLTEFPGAKYLDACDIAGQQVSDKSKQSSVQILNAFGIYPQMRKQEIDLGVGIMRGKLRMRVDGVPGLIVNPNQQDVIDGFKGGLHYPEVREGQAQKDVYEKEGYYEHIFDAARYLAVEMFTPLGAHQEQNQISDNSLEHAWRDGRPRMTLDPNEIESFEDDLGADPMAVSDY